MTILLVGEESAGIHTLKLIAQGPHRIAAVMASPDRSGASLWKAADTMGHATWDSRRVKDQAFAREVRDAGVDLLLNVHSLFLVHPDVLAAPRIGCYNLHPGPLPRYAGLNSVSWALYRGETAYGVTLHRMEPGIDTGPIAFQTLFEIAADDTALSLSTKCIREGLELVRRLLVAASRDAADIPRIAQNLSHREYFGGEAPDGCRVRWSHAARDIANLVRACDFFPFPSPWGHPRATLSGEALHIVKARTTGRATSDRPGTVGERMGDTIAVACADEWLAVDKVIVAGRSVPAVTLLGPGQQLDDGA